MDAPLEELTWSRPLVIVGEDDPDLAEAVIDILSRAGYDVLHASQGTEVLESARHHRAAVFLLDWWMPGDLAGRPLIRALRRLNDATPIIVYSSDEAARAEALVEGVSTFVRKPFSVGELRAHIAACANQTGAPSEFRGDSQRE
jgi:DNA-binding response OmpR family regulator